jgi:type VI secretion system protein ImpF
LPGALLSEGFLATVLDRLIGQAHVQNREPVLHRLIPMSKVKSLLIVDIENLLNSRRSLTAYSIEDSTDDTDNDIDSPLDKDLKDSIIFYGVKDFTAKNPKNPRLIQELCLDIRQTIERFETRLTQVNVHAVENENWNLLFRISAFLVIEPVKEPVSFNTYFDLSKERFSILK